MIVRYVCSNGKEYSLIGDRMRATSGNFHKYEWKQNSTEIQFGDSVYGFTKESVKYSITLTMRGKLESRKAMIDELTDAFEYDIVNATPGRIYYGEYYIDCYISGLSSEISGTWNNWTDCKVDIYCPYPFWSMEQSKSFYPDSAHKGEEYEFLDYPFDYAYDYSRPAAGSQHWIIDHYRNSNFKMTIYGPCANPRITINSHVYQVYDTLEPEEYMIIESRDKTVTKHLSNGTVRNIFAKREKKSSVFEKIPPGELLVSWSGDFGFDVTVYKERSVPKWS